MIFRPEAGNWGWEMAVEGIVSWRGKGTALGIKRRRPTLRVQCEGWGACVHQSIWIAPNSETIKT